MTEDKDHHKLASSNRLKTERQGNKTESQDCMTNYKNLYASLAGIKTPLKEKKHVSVNKTITESCLQLEWYKRRQVTYSMQYLQEPFTPSCHPFVCCYEENLVFAGFSLMCFASCTACKLSRCRRPRSVASCAEKERTWTLEGKRLKYFIESF